MIDSDLEHARLTDEAIDLVIRGQNTPDEPAAARLAQEWRGRSADHERIWARVMRVHGAAGKVLGGAPNRTRRARGISRRSFVIAGALGIGMLLGAGYLANREAPSVEYATQRGETRAIVLADGSKITLGAQSVVEVRLDAGARSVTLRSGSVYAEVARDESRPFSVRIGNLAATALGTAFDVSTDAGFVSVSVSHGSVEVATGGQSAELLAAGEWLRVGPSKTVERGRINPAQVAAWRDRFIVADRETVAALVTRIGRWLPEDVVVADAALGARRVSGVFDLNEPLRALEAAVHPADGVLVHRAGRIVVEPGPEKNSIE